MIVYSFLSIILFMLYVISIIIKNKGIPIHLSQSYYILNSKYLFTLFMLLLMYLTVVPLLEITPDNLKFLSFLSCCGIGFVGVSPNFIDDTEGKVHFYGALVAMVCSQILVLLCNPIILLTWIICGLLIFILYKFKWTLLKEKILFWIEIISFVNVYILLLK